MAEPTTLFGQESAQVPGGPQPGSPVQRERAVPEVLFRPQEKQEAVGFVQSLKTSFSLDSPIASVTRMSEAGGLPADPEFVLTPDVQNELLADVPDAIKNDMLDTLSGSVSRQHAELLKNQYLTEVERENLLASAGMGGLATRFLANVVDPVNLALAFGTGGVGVATKASTLRNAVRIGAYTALEEAAIETAIVQGSHTRGVDDVLFSALGGFVLGGVVGAGISKLQGDTASAAKITMNRQTDGVAREALEGSGLDSAGAKRVEGYTDPLVEDEVARAFDISTDPDVPRAAFAGARFDAVGQLGKHNDPFVRDLSRALAEEGVGVEGHGVVRFGASERAALTHRTLMTEFRRTSEPEFGNWLAETNHGWGMRYSLAKRTEFFQAVGKAVREGGSDSPAIARAAQSTSRAFSRYLNEAKKADVSGFRDIPANPKYLPRMFHMAGVREFVAKYGSDGLEKMVRAGMRSFDPDLDPAAVRKFAKAYVSKIRRLATGMDAGLTHGINMDDRDFLTQFLRDTDMDEAEIEAVLLNVQKRQDESKIGRAKRRLDIDEGVTVSLRNNETGEVDVRGFSDILENDAEKLLFGYSRTMSGWIGLARQANIKSPSDWNRVMDTVRSRNEALGNGIEDVLQPTEKRLQFLFDGITGVPLESDPAGIFARTGRVARDVNFLRIGAAFGFAQLAEVGNILGTAGFRNTLAHMPSLRGMIKRGVDGKLTNKLARDIEEMMAPGVDRLLNQASTRWEEHGFGVSGEKNALRAADNALQVAKRATSDIGGLNAATTVFQRMAASTIAQKMFSFARGAKLSEGQMKRMRTMGLSEEMWERIAVQLRENTGSRSSWVPGGRKLMDLNPEKWTDKDALDHFTLAMHREARRVVQENDIGGSTPWLQDTTGKLLTQFRSFALTSWSKATLHNIHHRDLQAFSILNTSMFMGALAYIAQTSINTKDPKEREEKLQVGEIAKASFQRTAMASVVPGLVDTFATTAFRTDPMFAYGRSSGLASGFIQGNPTVDLMDKMATLAGLPAVAARPDVEMTKRDYRSLTGMLPVLGGLVGVRRAIDSLAGDVAE